MIKCFDQREFRFALLPLEGDSEPKPRANTVVVVDILVWFVRAFFCVHSLCIVVGIKGDSFFRLRWIEVKNGVIIFCINVPQRFCLRKKV